MCLHENFIIQKKEEIKGGGETNKKQKQQK